MLFSSEKSKQDPVKQVTGFNSHTLTSSITKHDDTDLSQLYLEQ